MDRRILIGSLALGTFAVPRAASTQPERKVYRIGILSLRATAPRRGPAGHGAAGRRDRGGPSPLNRRHYPRGNCSRARARRRWTARRRAVPSAPGEVGHVQVWVVCHAAPHPTAAPRPGPRPTPFTRTTLQPGRDGKDQGRVRHRVPARRQPVAGPVALADRPPARRHAARQPPAQLFRSGDRAPRRPGCTPPRYRDLGEID